VRSATAAWTGCAGQCNSLPVWSKEVRGRNDFRYCSCIRCYIICYADSFISVYRIRQPTLACRRRHLDTAGIDAATPASLPTDPRNSIRLRHLTTWQAVLTLYWAYTRRKRKRNWLGHTPEKKCWQHCQTSPAVNRARPWRKRQLKNTRKRDLQKEMWLKCRSKK